MSTQVDINNSKTSNEILMTFREDQNKNDINLLETNIEYIIVFQTMQPNIEWNVHVLI